MPSQPSVGVDVPPFMPNYQWLLSLAADHCMSASGLRLSVVCLPHTRLGIRFSSCVVGPLEFVR